MIHDARRGRIGGTRRRATTRSALASLALLALLQVGGTLVGPDGLRIDVPDSEDSGEPEGPEAPTPDRPRPRTVPIQRIQAPGSPVVSYVRPAVGRADRYVWSITWLDQSDGEKLFVLERQEYDGTGRPVTRNWLRIHEAGSSPEESRAVGRTLQYRDEDLVDGHRYCYRVAAHAEARGGRGFRSAATCSLYAERSLVRHHPPPKPENVQAFGSADDAIGVSFDHRIDPPAKKIRGFRVFLARTGWSFESGADASGGLLGMGSVEGPSEASTGSQGGSLPWTLAVQQEVEQSQERERRSVRVGSLEHSSGYCVHVQAYNEYGDSPMSDVACTATYDWVNPPENLEIVALEPDRVELAWDDVDRTENRYLFGMSRRSDLRLAQPPAEWTDGMGRRQWSFTRSNDEFWTSGDLADAFADGANVCLTGQAVRSRGYRDVNSDHSDPACRWVGPPPPDDEGGGGSSSDGGIPDDWVADQVGMRLQPPDEENLSYFSLGLFINDATYRRIQFRKRAVPTLLHFLPEGHFPRECGKKGLVVTIRDGDVLTPEQMKKLWGTEEPRVEGTSFNACYLDSKYPPDPYILLDVWYEKTP